MRYYSVLLTLHHTEVVPNILKPAHPTIKCFISEAAMWQRLKYNVEKILFALRHEGSYANWDIINLGVLLTFFDSMIRLSAETAFFMEMQLHIIHWWGSLNCSIWQNSLYFLLHKIDVVPYFEINMFIVKYHKTSHYLVGSGGISPYKIITVKKSTRR